MYIWSGTRKWDSEVYMSITVRLIVVDLLESAPHSNETTEAPISTIRKKLRALSSSNLQRILNSSISLNRLPKLEEF
ncbi:hypothetical protein Nepgr_009545 [Nepenthes gracilis]|uniref:Uncharacterized protein n=1 Tax=Nepenthes gracilis TaxID=150966 RepID=A0AAD3SBC8_NEPGR|nr:hypothetical protein Nepgr_009545 [Nepenthes gracilis]